MKLYLLTQNLATGYDTYDSCVVAAESEELARQIHPYGSVVKLVNDKWMGVYAGGSRIGEMYEFDSDSWVKGADIESINVTYLGEAAPEIKAGLVLASFNAG